jgi:sugar phosphate isomerase/epimerase
LSFTDWYVNGLQGSAEGAFSFASRTGLQGVEVYPQYEGTSPRMLNSASLRQQYIDAQKKYGLKISSFHQGDFWMDKLVTDASSVDKMKSMIDLCGLMDVHLVLIPIFTNYADATTVDKIVERMKMVTPKAEAAGVTLAVENFETAETNAALLKRVGSTAFKVYYDIGNSSQRNRDIYAEIRTLGNSIGQFHVKDQETSAGVPGIGKIDFAKFKQVLVDINYHGWLILELRAGEAGYKSSADYLKKVFSPTP